MKTLNAAVSFVKHRRTTLKLNFTRKPRIRYALESLAINVSPPSEPQDSKEWEERLNDGMPAVPDNVE
ncbi:MAG: hypothetical protein OXN97_13380 [Bryobacterales bacterium]|nr:hypothetical protein [Bryobacterales bacterium]MDE0629480.1 hypothetical protein [Bryobacterales bacterium]